MSALEQALVSARHGLRAFPAHNPLPGGLCSCGDSVCSDVGKHPRLSGWQAGATTDERRIKAWLQRWPHANYLITTGSGSNVVVLDVDPAAGGDEALMALEARNGRLPATVEAVSGSGGAHRYFAYPGVRVPNSAGKLGPGLDVRGDGGYAIGPGSLHRNGRRYAWELSSHPDETLFAPMPSWLLTLAVGDPADGRERFDTAAALLGVPEGQRDDVLFRLACKLRHADVPIDWAERLVLEAAANCRPPLPTEQGLAKVRGAYHRYAPTFSEKSGGVSRTVRVVVG